MKMILKIIVSALSMTPENPHDIILLILSVSDITRPIK